MAKKILTANQLKILTAIGEEPFLTENFYLSGGTALAGFYLYHRYSEDLDFFSEEEFEPQNIFIFFKARQKKLSLKKIDYQQSFNRNLFFLYLKDELIKTEFTYFPFTRLQKGLNHYQVAIDSLLDIAVNKLFTIYQQPRSRDFIDLYFILKKEKLSIQDLVKKAKVKFDWHIDPIQLGSRFLQVTELKDYPRLIAKINHKVWQDFFIKEAGLLKSYILET
ncbi:MAG TPA: nucleotidyl transferase AbiEii/AbiGii toxin family protein [Patescibacteria group bacterium]|nr:nucleotidyl transferase AbiEii/AbiGii toxin family protein [Patescibacteria group bacterium]